MAITIKKDTKKQEAPSTNGIAYLPAEIQTEVSKLSPEVQAKFAEFTELTPDVIDAVAQDVDEALLEVLLSTLEAQLAAQVPSTPVVQPAAEAMAQVPASEAETRKAKRDELKAQIASQSKTPVTVPASAETPVLTPDVADTAPTMPAALSLWDQLFPVGQSVTVVNRGGGRFELQIGTFKVKAAPAEPKATAEEKPKKEKKVSVSTISANPKFWTPEYKQFMADMKEKYPELPARVTYAESLGLVRGTDWADKTKDGNAMPTQIENMYLLTAIRAKLGIEQYIEGARTTEERKAIALGQAPVPAAAQ